MSACDIILDQVDSIHKGIRPLKRRPWYRLQNLNLKLYMELNAFANKILVGTKDRGEYSTHKFSQLLLPELIQVIERLKTTSGKFGSVDSRCLGENLFLIQ